LGPADSILVVNGASIHNAGHEDVMSYRESHHHTPDEERRIREAALDETIAESFPASDPPSSLPNPDEHDAEGSGVGPDEKPPSSRE
jgi:hypothetical protein